MELNDTNTKDFLTELTELTIKHGIAIAGCGCCGSPYLTPLAEGEEQGSYQFNKYAYEPYEHLEWEVSKNS